MKHTFALVTFLLLALAAAGAQMAAPQALTPAQFAAVSSGQPVNLAVRVNALKRTTLTGELLERQTGSLYKATGKIAQLYYPPQTPVVMGSGDDVRPGAVLFVYAIATTPGHADVKKVTVVSSYVKVE